MKKVALKVLMLTVVLICLLALTSCFGGGGGDTPEPTDPTVIAIEVDLSTVPDYFYQSAVEDVDLSDISVDVIYSDSTTTSMTLNLEMISLGSRSKFNTVGNQRIEVVYGGCTGAFQVTIVTRDKEVRTLTVTNGKPTHWNGNAYEPGDLYNEETKTFSGVFSDGDVIRVVWEQKTGYHFAGWLKNGLYYDAMSIIEIEMLENINLLATDSLNTNTVHFVTNSDLNDFTRYTNLLTESILPAMTKDNYVFDGWTTTALTGENANNTVNIPKIVLPYHVSIETYLYATWRSLGLEFDSYTNVATNTTGYRINNYRQNDTVLTIPEIHNGLPVIAITRDAFNNASNLKTVNIPSNMEEIADGAFRNCPQLIEFTVADASGHYSALDSVLYSNSGDTLVAYPAGKLAARYEPSASVVHIKAYAFQNAAVGGMTLPASLLSVGTDAFYSIHFDYIQFTGSPLNAGFSLAADIFHENLSHIFVENSYQAHYEGLAAFADYQEIVTPMEGNVLTDIQMNADKTFIFRVIRNENSDRTASSNTAEIIAAKRDITTILLPGRIDGRIELTSIGTYAFSDCAVLETVTVPSGSFLERICKGAFDGTPWVAKILADDSQKKSIIFNNILYSYLGTESIYVLDRTVSRIAEGAFRDNKTIKSIDLSSTNTELSFIGAYAFYNCTALGGEIMLKNKVTAVYHYAFAGTKITGIILSGESVLTTIGQGAFERCSYLIKVAIGARTSNISADAFNHCYSLTEFTIQSPSTSFYAVDGILYEYLPDDSVAGQPGKLFLYPAGRMSAVFNPNKPTQGTTLSIREIGDYAFFYSNIAALYLPRTVAAVSTTAVYIPGLIYVAFEEPIANFTYNNLFISDPLGVGKHQPQYVVFEDMSGLNASTMVDAFFGSSTALKTQKLQPAVYHTIGITDNGELIYAYDSDNNVLSIVGANRVLAVISIPDTITGHFVSLVAPYAFYGSYLEQIELGANIDRIEDYAFYYATGLQKIYAALNAVATPTLNANSFGEGFNNGILIYAPRADIDSYIYVWSLGNDKYIIPRENDGTEGKPYAKFTYRSGEEAEVYPDITGELTALNLPQPKRQGYTFDGWYTDDNVKIDVSAGPYAIPYNIILTARWVSVVYTIRFVVEQGVSLSKTEITVEFGTRYNLETPTYPHMTLVGWQDVSGRRYESSGNWEIYLDSDILYLYPIWKETTYTLLYSGQMNPIEEISMTVTYNTAFTLVVPTLEGHVFLGWLLKTSENQSDWLLITGTNGVSILRWTFTDKEEYEVHPSWMVKQEITVNLYFAPGELYLKITDMVYGDTFDFNVDINKIGEESWRQQSAYFGGWFDSYDYVNNTGYGTRYTDDLGKGLTLWSRSTETDLYAQWPLDVSDGAFLENLSGEGLSYAYKLTNNVTVTKPIGSKTEPFKGVFFGNNFKVTFNYTADSSNQEFDGYTGLFAYNMGIIKNLRLDADIDIQSTARYGSDFYFGVITARNEGKIVYEGSTSSSVSATVKIALSSNGIVSYIGGMVGYNTGTVQNMGISLHSLAITVAGSAYNRTTHTQIKAGSVVGVMADGMLQCGNVTSHYTYTAANDPFKGVRYGECTQGLTFVILVTETQVT